MIAKNAQCPGLTPPAWLVVERGSDDLRCRGIDRLLEQFIADQLHLRRLQPAIFLAQIAGKGPGLDRLDTMAEWVSGLGYIGVAMSPSFLVVAFFFLVAGAGAGFQHSLSSSLLVRTFKGPDRRRALGHYNSAGDAGKLIFTGIFSLATGAGIGWNWIVVALALTAIVFGFYISQLIPRAYSDWQSKDTPTPHTSTGWGILSGHRFSALAIMVFLDSTVQAVFLTFLAFVLLSKGASEGTASFAVVLALSGGMVGKFCCGHLAARIGDRKTFGILQVLTVFGIFALIILPVTSLMIILPVIGLAVQGSSTVTYGSVSDFIAENRQARGYALIYSFANGASIGGPFLFGLIADFWSLHYAMWMLIALILLTFPFSAVLANHRAIKDLA